MAEILDQLFSSFGTIGLMIVAVFAALVWALAHFSAQPGTAVSVLWGLVSYTKPEQHRKPADTRSEDLPAQTLGAPNEEVSPDFTKGASLEIMIENSEEVPDGTKYIRLSRDWTEGVNKALEALTEVQKEEELQKLVGDARAIIEGEVSEVDYSGIRIRDESGEWVIKSYDVDEDTRRLIRNFHKGDRIRLHAEVTKPYLWILTNPTAIQRVAKR